jgi:hypothetical protein
MQILVNLILVTYGLVDEWMHVKELGVLRFFSACPAGFGNLDVPHTEELLTVN